MPGQLNAKRVAMLVAYGFEQVELTGPKEALEKLGAKVSILSPNARKVKGWNHTDWGDEFSVDVPLQSATTEDFDALVLPGGVKNPDKLRRNEWALQFVREFFESGKPIAAICHGPWTLIDAGLVEGKRMTSYESLQTNLKNSGAHWVDEPVVVDNGLVTSRKPDDIPAFNQKLIEEISEGVHAVR
jgi:protease I